MTPASTLMIFTSAMVSGTLTWMSRAATTIGFRLTVVGPRPGFPELRVPKKRNAPRARTAMIAPRMVNGLPLMGGILPSCDAISASFAPSFH